MYLSKVRQILNILNITFCFIPSNSIDDQTPSCKRNKCATITRAVQQAKDIIHDHSSPHKLQGSPGADSPCNIINLLSAIFRQECKKTNKICLVAALSPKKKV